MYYIGLDVHKRTISYCVKDASGRVYPEGAVPATRCDLDRWMRTLPKPRTAAMEATVFTGWIYDHLLPYAAALKVAHPLMLRAIAAARKKNDRIDASKICDCYNHHVRLLSPEPAVVDKPQSTWVEEPTLLCNHLAPSIPIAAIGIY